MPFNPVGRIRNINKYAKAHWNKISEKLRLRIRKTHRPQKERVYDPKMDRIGAKETGKGKKIDEYI